MILKQLRNFADRSWYAPLVGLLAGVDHFILVVPIEPLMIPSVLVRPSRWWKTGLWVSTGSAIGAMLLAMTTEHFGMPIIERWAPQLVRSATWGKSIGFVDSYGAWALFGFALSPFPPHPAIALAGLSHMPLARVFIAIWIGRSIKYAFISYLASHAPKLLAKAFPSFFPTPIKPIQTTPKI